MSIVLLNSASDDVRVQHIITSSLALCDGKGSESTSANANDNRAGPLGRASGSRVTATANPIQRHTETKVVSFRFLGIAAFVRNFGFVIMFELSKRGQTMKTEELNPAVIDIPVRWRKLPVFRGFPVPFFVDYLENGEPEFRATDPRKFKRCYRERLCWICGEPLGTFLAFVIGPMCAVNRITSELPNHRECAEWAAKVCPFLARPKAHYRPGLPEGFKEPAGVCLDRNPGVAMIWVTRSYSLFRAEKGNAGYLVNLGEPEEVLAFCEGRKATREEIMHSIDTGLPILREASEKAGEPDEARAELDRRYEETKQLVGRVA